jgi:hypothetical protein
MKSQARALVFSFVVFSLPGVGLAAAELAGSPVLVPPSGGNSQLDPHLTARPEGGFALVWREDVDNLELTEPDSGLFLARFDRQGVRQTDALPYAASGSGLGVAAVALPRVTDLGSGDLELFSAVSSSTGGPPRVERRLWNPGQPPSAQPRPVTVLRCPAGSEVISDLAVDSVRPAEAPGFGGGGIYAVAACRDADGFPGLFLHRQPLDGSPGELVRVDQGSGIPAARVSLAVDPRGRVLVAWTTDDVLFQVRSRLLFPLAEGENLRPVEILGQAVDGSSIEAIALAGPDGGFVVGWREPTIVGGDSRVVTQYLGPGGAPLGPRRPVSGPIQDVTLPTGERTGPALAAGPGGRWAVTWVEPLAGVADQDLLRLRLYDHRMEPLPGAPNGPLVISPRFAFPDFADTRITAPTVAWDRAGGSALVVWQGSNPELPFPQVRLVAQLVKVSETAAPRDELCVMSGNRLRCASLASPASDPALLDIRFGNGLAAGLAPLLTDLDGDGRDDLCLGRDGIIRCDLAGDGVLAEAGFRFGDTLDDLVGGDLGGLPRNRGDVCYRAPAASNRFVCDTDQAGTPAELVLAFGPADSRAFLGDANGDGRDEMCLVFGGLLRCDVAQDGGGAELFRPVDAAVANPLADGGIPLLADVDGDGVDELCVAYDGRFTCDMGDSLLEVEPPGGADFAGGDVPLVGNVDGL